MSKNKGFTLHEHSQVLKERSEHAHVRAKKFVFTHNCVLMPYFKLFYPNEEYILNFY